MRNIKIALAFSLGSIGSFGCSDVECGDGEIKIADECFMRTRGDAGSGEAGSGDVATDADSSSTGSEDAASDAQSTGELDADSPSWPGIADAGATTEPESESDAGSGDGQQTPPSSDGSVEDAASAARDAGPATGSPPATDAASPGPSTSPPKPTCTPKLEVCDGVDNDCDNQIDEGVKTRCWPDADGDGLAATGAAPVEVCGQCGAQRTPMEPKDVDSIDCNDADPALKAAVYWYPDCDGDGFGVLAGSKRACATPAAAAGCQSYTRVRPEAGTTFDCRDDDRERFPGQMSDVGGVTSDPWRDDVNCDGKVEINESRVAARYPDGRTVVYKYCSVSPTCVDACPMGNCYANCPSGQSWLPCDDLPCVRLVVGRDAPRALAEQACVQSDAVLFGRTVDRGYCQAQNITALPYCR